MGAGLAGLALAHFAQKMDHEVRVYTNGPAASNVGSGLLHPYGGARAKLNRFGKEGMKESLSLIPKSAIIKKGILRLGHDLTFLSTLEKPLSAEEVIERNPGCAPIPGVLIEEAYVIDMAVYLSHLSQGLTIHSTPEEWGDVTLWAIGAYSSEVKKVKGQKLLIKIKDHGLTDPINAGCYIIPLPDSLIVGATYERDNTDWHTDIEKTKSILFPKLKEVMPAFDESRIESIECFAGLRAVTPDHLPLIKQLDSKNWLFTGLGSKGLLYHALYAKILFNKINESSFAV